MASKGLKEATDVIGGKEVNAFVVETRKEIRNFEHKITPIKNLASVWVYCGPDEEYRVAIPATVEVAEEEPAK